MSINVNRSDDAIYVITNEDQVIYVTTISNTIDLNGIMVVKGTYDASSNIFPSNSGIKKGWWYKISVSGTLGGIDVPAGAKIMALVDNPSNSLSDWDITF